jgi:catechol 2,3-dioxygenase-like lactoylglutathione lyase family enzyme
VTRFISILIVGIAWPSHFAWAQLAPANELNVTWSHVHVMVPDRDKEAKSWLTLGGQLGNNLTGDNVAVAFPGIVILLGQGDTKGGSAGAVLDHVAFRVPSLPNSMAKWKAANWGLKEQPGAAGPRQAFLTTLNQVKIEILEDQSLKVPIVFDHVHFIVPEASLQKIDGYYVKLFGFKPVKSEPYTYSLPGGKLVFSIATTPTVPTAGRPLDHIGFDIAGSHDNLEAFSKTLEANRVEFRSPYRKSPMGNARPLDPLGVMTELTHGVAGYADFTSIDPAVFPCENRSAKCW